MRRALAALALASLAACSGGDRPYVPGVDAPVLADVDAGWWIDAPSGVDAAEVIDAPSRVDAGEVIDAPSRVDAGGPVEVSVTIVGQGVVVSAPAGIRCQPTCRAVFPPGTVVTLSAMPAAGWSFAGWSDGCTGGGPCAVPGSVAVTATFVRDSCILGVERQGPGQGTVVSSPAGINCGPDCREPYPCGSFVTLTAIPAAGSVFAGWSGACTGTATCTVLVGQPFQAAIATFR